MATRTITVQSDVLLTALGGAIVAGDSAYINRYANDFTSADLSATDLSLVELTSGFSGRFIASGGLLKLTCNQTSTGIFRNAGNAPRVDLASTSVAGVIYNIINRPLNGNSVLDVSACLCTNFLNLTGSAVLQSDVNATNVYVQGGSLQGKYVASLPATLVTVAGGSCIWSRDLTNAFVKGGGTLTIDNTECTPSGAITMDGGTLIIQRCGLTASLTGQSGTVDLRQLDQPLTFTARTCHPGVTILMPANASLVTFTGTTGELFGGPRIVGG